MVARKYETDNNLSSTTTSTSSSTAQLKKRNNRSNRRYFCCFYTESESCDVNDRATVESIDFSNLNSFDQHHAVKCDANNNYLEINSSKPFLSYYSCFNATIPCRRSFTNSSIDSKCSADNDLVTVPVSRSIKNLSLNIYVYFHVADNEYVCNHLVPCLKKCLTIIPDTKFIIKPQTQQYIIATDSYQEECSYILNLAAKSRTLHKQDHLLLNTLTANILVISDSFFGFYSTAHNTDSLISLKYSKQNPDLTTLHITNHSSSSGISSNSSSNSVFNNSDNLQAKARKSYILHSPPPPPPLPPQSEDTKRNNFKIYLKFSSLDDNQQQQQQSQQQQQVLLKDNFNLFTSSKAFSLNQRLMKRIYETSNKSISSDNRISMQIQNDISSCTAYSEKLQFKLEKYFEHVCMKSSTFSDKNFSYVDYTKR